MSNNLTSTFNSFKVSKLFPLFLTVAFFNAVFLFGCKESAATYELNDIDNKQILLNEWKVLGPFLHFDDVDILFDDLKELGLSAETISFEKLDALKTDSTDILDNQLMISDSTIIDFIDFFGLADTIYKSASAYAYCEINSVKDQEVMLNYSAESGTIVWLNNEMVHEANKIYNKFMYYDKYIELPLKKGSNFLLIKSRPNEGKWRMFACLEKKSKNGINRNKANSILEYDRSFLSLSLIDNDSLSLGWWVPYDFSGPFTIKGEQADTLINISPGQRFICNLNSFPDGLYKTRFINSVDTMTQFFFKGDFHKCFNDLLSELYNRKHNTTIKNNIDAYSFRYHHLMKPENIPQESYNIPKWHRKFIYLYRGLYSINRSHHEDQTPVTNINTYVSEIDNGVQYYQLYLPENYTQKDTLPLLIELSVPNTRFQSPLETYKYADIGAADLVEYLTNKYHIAILKPGFRTTDISNQNNIDEADLWENIAALQKICNIDSSRIYLKGACESAFNALRLGVKHPDKWAAIAFTSPRLIHVDKNNIPLVMQNDPVNLLGNLWDTPILNIHSKLHQHTNIVSSYYLGKLAEKEGFKHYTFRELPLEFEEYYSAEYYDDMVRFLVQHSTKERENNEIKFSTYQLKNNKVGWFEVLGMKNPGKCSVNGKVAENHVELTTENVHSFSIDLTKLPFNKNEKLIITHNRNDVYDGIPDTSVIEITPDKSLNKKVKTPEVEGPFAHIFNSSFIVVPGTIGSPDETRQNEKITSQINDMWKALYYSGCRIINDSDITTHDIENSNLLLIGNEHNNDLIKRYKSSLPISTTDSNIQIGEKTLPGDKLNYYLVYPNPDYKENYIALLGYNTSQFFTLLSEKQNSECNNISNFGWYDFKVWSAVSGEIHKGFFDKDWKETITHRLEKKENE